MILAQLVSPVGHETIEASKSSQYIFEPVPLQIYLFILTNVAPPAEQDTPSGQYIVADDGQDWHVQVPDIGQNIFADLHFLDPDAIHFNSRDVASIPSISDPLN